MNNAKKKTTVPTIAAILFCGCILVPQIVVKAATFPQDYISWWKFEGDANDETGTNDGSLTNGANTVYNAQRQSQVLILEGIDDYVDVGSFDISGGGLTISAWIKSDNLIDQSRIIDKSTSSVEQDHYWMLGTYDSGGMKLRFRLKTDGTTSTLIASTGVLSADEWIHAVAVYDGNDMILYKDGMEVGRTAKTGSISPNSVVGVNIGRNPDGYEFDGLIDDTMLFNRALSPQEVSKIYQTLKQSLSTSSLCDMVGYWRLDESTSGSYEDSAGDSNGSCAGVCPDPNSFGRVEGTQVFNGSTTGIDISTDDVFNWGKDDSFAIEFWMKRESPIGGSVVNDNEVIIGRDDNSTDLHWWFGIKYGTGAAHFQLGSKNSQSGDTVVLEGPAIDDGRWHHLVGVRDGVNKINRLYVDGVDVNDVSFTYVADFNSNTAALNLGWLNLSGGFHYEGKLDEVAIYNRVLSAEEIRSQYYFARGYCDMCFTISIMPLGDSITVGNASGASPDDAAHWLSFRKYLWESLNDAGYDVDFVGYQSNGDAFDPPFDSNHAGYGGITDNQIEYLLDTGYNQKTSNQDTPGPYLDTYQPDVILLHIGTNGLNSDPQDVNNILDEIDEYEAAYNTAVTVVLAKIINRRDGSTTTTSFNNNVAAMAQTRIDQGDRIIIVDMENGAGIIYGQAPGSGDMWDNLHPYETGYAKMSSVWLDALDDFLPLYTPQYACPSSMISYWHLDEQTSGSYLDYYGFNDGLCAGICPDPNVNGTVENAQVFDGSTTGIDISADISLDWAQGDSFSIELWMKRDTAIGGAVISDNEVIIGRDDAATNLHWWFGLWFDGKARFQLGDTTGQSIGLDGPSIDDGVWHHLVGVRDADVNENRLYVDGVKEANGIIEYSAGFDSTDANINMGWLNLSPFYHV